VKRKPLIPREQARRDVEEIVIYCLSEAAETAGRGFICETYYSSFFQIYITFMILGRYPRKPP